MSIYDECLASFSSWPHTSPAPEDLARLGLSHRPTSKMPDNVICKKCKTCLCDWEPEDDPELELHILHQSCSRLWKSENGSPISLSEPLPKDIGFFDPSLQHDVPELCLFQNAYTFCDHVKRCRFVAADILELLPKCLRGQALTWFRDSKHRDLAGCLRAMRARFPQAAPQASQQAPQQASPQKAPQPIEYHYCKLCNASFSSMTRLIQHAQENVCNKPSCRHCEMVFSSKNRLHHHLREGCQKWMHRQPSFSPSPSPACSPTCSPAYSPVSLPAPRILSPAPLPEENRASLPPSPSPSPPPKFRAISPPPPTYKNYLTVDDLYARYAAPPYLKMDDLFRMFRRRSAPTTSTITIRIDDPFVRPFVLPKKSIGSTQIWELGMITSHHQIPRAQCFPPRCRPPTLLNTEKRQASPIWA